MFDTAVTDSPTSAAATIGAPVKAAGDTVVEALSGLVGTAAKRGRKARKQATNRAQHEVTQQRRKVRKAVAKANKQSRKAWAEFADETVSRANNIVEAGKGAQVKPRGKKRRVAAVLALVGAVAVVAVAKKKQQDATNSGTAPDAARTPTRVP